MKLANYMAEYLYQQGIRNVYMLSGSGSIHLNDAFAHHKGLKCVCARHEAAAVMMAVASAKLTGNLGVAIVTTGPGGTNAIGGLAEAWVDSVPVLIISGQSPTDHIIKDQRSYGIQGFNIVKVVRGITKNANVVLRTKDVGYCLDHSICEAKKGRPGPVWLDIPLDIQNSEKPIDKVHSIENPNHVRRYREIKSKIISKELVKLLNKSKRPIIIVGQGLRQSGAMPELEELMKYLDIPIISSRLGNDCQSFCQKNYFGMGGIRGLESVSCMMKACDLVISFGSSLSQPFAGQNYSHFNSDAKIVIIDIDSSASINCKNYTRRSELISVNGISQATPNKWTEKIKGIPILVCTITAKPVITELTKKIKETSLPDYSEWLNECYGFRDKYPVITAAHKKNPIDLYYFVSRLNELAHKKTVFVSDAGSAYYVTGQVLQFKEGQREVTSGTFASMGTSIPFAIGCAATWPDYQIVVITGDGSIELNIQELKTISQYNLNIKIFVINNGGYASIRDTQNEVCEGRHIGNDSNLNFKKVANTFGMIYDKISHFKDIEESIECDLCDTLPMLIEVVCDKNQKIVKNFE